MSTIEELARDVKAAFEAKTSELDSRLREVEQKGARSGGSGRVTSLGEQFVETKGAELASMGRADRVALETKATITSSIANADGSAGDLVVPSRDSLASLPKRRLTIRNLMSVIQVTSGSVEYPRQKTQATGAAMVAEGALKPQSGLQFEMKNAPIRTIAHWVKASRQILDDAPQLSGLIDVELRYGLALLEEAQVLYGDGTGQNLLGIVPQATDFDDDLRQTGDTKIDTIGRAIYQASLTDLPPDGIVIHPGDWWDMRLTKDADGKYILGDPMTDVAPNLFGLPVVPTKAHNAGEFTVGAFGAQTIYDRWQARVELGFVDDDFTRNLVTVLGEERIGFAAKQPQAVINGAFAATP